MTSEELNADILRQLKELPAQRKALILKNSHIGGHRYAGNCIVSISFKDICMPLIGRRFITRKDPEYGMAA
jgi:hypothetical protein